MITRGSASAPVSPCKSKSTTLKGAATSRTHTCVLFVCAFYTKHFCLTIIMQLFVLRHCKHPLLSLLCACQANSRFVLSHFCTLHIENRLKSTERWSFQTPVVHMSHTRYCGSVRANAFSSHMRRNARMGGIRNLLLTLVTVLAGADCPEGFDKRSTFVWPSSILLSYIGNHSGSTFPQVWLENTRLFDDKYFRWRNLLRGPGPRGTSWELGLLRSFDLLWCRFASLLLPSMTPRWKMAFIGRQYAPLFSNKYDDMMIIPDICNFFRYALSAPPFGVDNTDIAPPFGVDKTKTAPPCIIMSTQGKDR